MLLGQYNNLRVVRAVTPGLILTDGENDVLLPNRLAPRDARPGDELRVFVYTDSEDRPVATTQKPKAVVGDFAVLKCVSSGKIGAFLDWGLDKDLLVPHGQQRAPMFAESSYLVKVLLDEKSGRIIGSSKINRYIEEGAGDLQEGQEVDLLIYRLFPDGALAIVDGRFSGLIPQREIHEPLRHGDRRQGFVTRVSPEGKVTLSLSRHGYGGVLDATPKVLRMLEESGGSLPYNDATDPETIKRVFGMSKGAFKKVLGSLLREGKIQIESEGIRLKG